jgi:hypothetical protein
LGQIYTIGSLVVGIIPGSLSVDHGAAEAAFKSVEAIERVFGVGPGRYAKEVVAGAAIFSGLPDRLPLESIGSHKAALFS